MAKERRRQSRLTRSPLPLGGVGTPLLPVLLAQLVVLEALLLCTEIVAFLNCNHGREVGK